MTSAATSSASPPSSSAYVMPTSMRLMLPLSWWKKMMSAETRQPEQTERRTHPAQVWATGALVYIMS
uniref:Uncharacterized protein n=1 Tax=Arundo donax TaxID=35708 RepID=A0A0A9B5I7_ARUDO